jgi:hypothetical protein
MKKTFDCVAMKRRGAEKIYKQIAGMTTEQELAFWQQRTNALKQRQRSIHSRHRKSGRAVSHFGLVPQFSAQ